MSTSRYDGFLIWGHGIPYIREIMSIIRSRFEIIVILRKKLDDVRAFVDQIYQLDSYPIELIREKTDYLLQQHPEAVYVLVRNDHVDLWDVDMGKYAKKECRYIAHTKVLIREKWNKHPHHHVLHGTDTEEEARHILRLFGGGEIEQYLVNSGTPFPWHVAPFEYEEVDVDLRTLEGTILDDYWRRGIEFTPHYLYAIGNKQPYQDYHERHYGIGLIEDHFPEKFDNMIVHYKKGGEFPPILVIGDNIIDGGHRAAIYMADKKYIVRALKKKEQAMAKVPRKRVLLVGGTGGVGQQLQGGIDDSKYEVVSVGSSKLDVTDQTIDFKQYGNPEVVVVLSGLIDYHRLDERSDKTRRLIEVNCIGAINILSGFLPTMRERGYGRIIFMSSIFSDFVVKGYGTYGASKAFIDRLVKNAALENADRDVTVNSIQLGYTGVGMGIVADEELRAKVVNKPAVKRFYSPAELSRLIDFIVSTGYFTGQNVKLDGFIK